MYRVIINNNFLNQKKGYAGYIPSKKSENLYGKTYAKVTYLSST